MNFHLLLAPHFTPQAEPATMPAYTDTPNSRSYIRSSIGGAENYEPTDRKNTTTFPSPPRTAKEPTTSFHTGIGDAGNSASSENRTMLSASDEQEHESLRRNSTATSWYRGIGGAENRATSDDAEWSDGTSSISSSDCLKSSVKMERKSAADRLKEKIAQKWERRNQRVSLFQSWQRKLPVIEKEAADVRSGEIFDGFAVKY